MIVALSEIEAIVDGGIGNTGEVCLDVSNQIATKDKGSELIYIGWVTITPERDRKVGSGEKLTFRILYAFKDVMGSYTDT